MAQYTKEIISMVRGQIVYLCEKIVLITITFSTAATAAAAVTIGIARSLKLQVFMPVNPQDNRADNSFWSGLADEYGRKRFADNRESLGPIEWQREIGENAAAEANTADKAISLAVTDDALEAILPSRRRIVTRTILSSKTRIIAGLIVGCGRSNLSSTFACVKDSPVRG